MSQPLPPSQPIPTIGHHLLVPDWVDQANNGTVILGKEASKHLGQVLRIQVGEPISLTDGRGQIAQTHVVEATKTVVRVDVTDRWHQDAWPSRFRLMHALPKAKKLDEVIRRACELGVDDFYPIQSARCDRKLDTAKADTQVERWQAIADSATEQSRRAWAMQVHSVTPMPTRESSDLTSGGVANRFVFWEEATQPLQQALNAIAPGDLTMLVGPEGGLTAEEVNMSGFTPVRIGPRILRTETAGVTAAALGSWHLDRLN